MALMILGVNNTDSWVKETDSYTVYDTDYLHTAEVQGRDIIAMVKAKESVFLNVFPVHVDGKLSCGIARQSVRFEDFIKLGIGLNSEGGRMSHTSKSGICTKLVFDKPFTLKRVVVTDKINKNSKLTLEIQETADKDIFAVVFNGVPVVFLKSNRVKQNIESDEALPVYRFEMIGVWLEHDDTALTCLFRFGEARGVVDGGVLENIKFTVNRETGKLINADISEFNSTHGLKISKFQVLPADEVNIARYIA